MPEQFSVRKALDLSPTAMGKSFSIGLKIAIILFVGWAVYKAYFKKPEPTQTQRIERIVVESGGTLTLQEQKEEEKRKWYIPSPYVRVCTFARTNDEKGFGVEFGAEWRW